MEGLYPIVRRKRRPLVSVAEAVEAATRKGVEVAPVPLPASSAGWRPGSSRATQVKQDEELQKDQARRGADQEEAKVSVQVPTKSIRQEGSGSQHQDRTGDKNANATKRLRPWMGSGEEAQHDDNKGADENRV